MSEQPPTEYAPPGWFPDPTGLQAERWWDGAQWGRQTRFLPGNEQEPQLPYQPQQAYGQQPRQPSFTPDPQYGTAPGQPPYRDHRQPEPPAGHRGRPARKSWPQRHKVLTVLGSLTALIIVIAGDRQRQRKSQAGRQRFRRRHHHAHPHGDTQPGTDAPCDEYGNSLNESHHRPGRACHYRPGRARDERPGRTRWTRDERPGCARRAHRVPAAGARLGPVLPGPGVRVQPAGPNRPARQPLRRQVQRGRRHVGG